MVANGLWLGLAAAAGAIVTTIAGRNAASMGQQFVTEEADIEDIDAAGSGGGGGGPSGGGGGGGGLGPVAGMPSGGGGGGGAGPALGPVAGMPSPPSPGGPAGGFPGTFPTMGPASTIFGFDGRRRFNTRFLFGNGGDYWWGWPYYYPPAPNPQYSCQWEETPPKEDTKMICTPVPGAYPVVNAPVAWGPPGWAWW